MFENLQVCQKAVDFEDHVCVQVESPRAVMTLGALSSTAVLATKNAKLSKFEVHGAARAHVSQNRAGENGVGSMCGVCCCSSSAIIRPVPVARLIPNIL